MPLSEASVPVGSSAYGWPSNVMLSARKSSSASGLSLRWLTAVTNCSRTNSTSAGSSRGAAIRSAMIAQVLSNPAVVARKPTLVQSTPALTPIALPSRAIFVRRRSRGYFCVPRSLASSSISSIPCVAEVSCREPPRR